MSENKLIGPFNLDKPIGIVAMPEFMNTENVNTHGLYVDESDTGLFASLSL